MPWDPNQYQYVPDNITRVFVHIKMMKMWRSRFTYCRALYIALCLVFTTCAAMYDPTLLHSTDTYHNASRGGGVTRIKKKKRVFKWLDLLTNWGRYVTSGPFAEFAPQPLLTCGANACLPLLLCLEPLTTPFSHVSLVTANELASQDFSSAPVWPAFC